MSDKSDPELTLEHSELESPPSLPSRAAPWRGPLYPSGGIIPLGFECTCKGGGSYSQ